MGAMWSSWQRCQNTLQKIYIVYNTPDKKNQLKEHEYRSCIAWPNTFQAFCEAIESLAPGYGARHQYYFLFEDEVHTKEFIWVFSEASFQGLVPRVKTLNGDKTERVQIWYCTCHLV
jgi:hypothetical protein